MLTLTVSCNKDIDEPEKDSAPVSGEIKAMIESLGFNAFDAYEFDGFYIIEGDIRIHKDSLQNYVQPKTKQARYNYVVSRGRFIKIFVNATIPTSTNWRQAMDSVINSYNGLGLGIRMKSVQSAADANIIVQYGSLGSNICGEGTWPTSNGNPGNYITLNSSFNWLSISQKRLLLAHELGHNLGLRHTNWQSNNESGGILVPGTPASDSQSVMNANTCGNGWGGFSTADITALNYLFPPYNNFTWKNNLYSWALNYEPDIFEAEYADENEASNFHQAKPSTPPTVEDWVQDIRIGPYYITIKFYGLDQFYDETKDAYDHLELRYIESIAHWWYIAAY
jgi:hypothetical protein